MKEYDFAKELQVALSDILTGEDVSVSISPFGGEYVIRAEMGVSYASSINERDIPEGIRRTVIWTFENGGRVAWIKIPNLNFMYIAASLMAGNLFGQGLHEARRLNRGMAVTQQEEPNA